MSKLILLLLALIVLSQSQKNENHIQFQFGTHLARLVRSQGQIVIPCIGGSGNYRYQYRNLPRGWQQKGNSLVIPGILNVNGQYDINARVEDSEGNVLQENVKLTINGVIVNIHASADAQNKIQYEVGSQNNQGSSQSSSSQSSVTVTSNVDISHLYEDELGLPGDQEVLPESGKYPTPPSPTGKPQTPNIVPHVIQNAQAEYNLERDQRKITIDEVKRNAIFNRQITANKAVANLLAIIQQLTANVNAAKADIIILEKNLAEAEAANNACNDEIFKLSNTRTKIQNAIKSRQMKIEDVNNRIAELRPIIAELERKRDALVEDRTAIENERSPNAAKLASLEDELAACQKRKRDLENDLEDLRSQIAEVEAEIQTVKDDAAGAPGAIEQINTQIPIVDDKIEDLKKQLEDAEAEKTQLLADRDMYQRMIDEAEAKIAELEGILEELNDRIPGLERAIEETQIDCDRIQGELDDLRAEIAANEADYKILTEEIRVQNGLIQDRLDEVDRLNESIKNFPTEIHVLQRELNRIMAALRRQYYICNDRAEVVRKAKQNLDAMVLKFNTESRYLLEANKNLEAARAEKELADIAVEEIIRSSTDANLFSIVPNGLGETDAGNPPGNNPSGSPLGPVKERNEVPPGAKVQIGDLRNYLSQSYGAGVDLARPSTVSYLYPLSVVTIEAITGKSEVGIFNPDGTFRSSYPKEKVDEKGELPKFDCTNSNDLVQGEATVKSVQKGAIKIQLKNGDHMFLEISSCTKLESTKEHNVITTYDKVFFKGNKNAWGTVELQKLTCV